MRNLRLAYEGTKVIFENVLEISQMPLKNHRKMYLDGFDGFLKLFTIRIQISFNNLIDVFQQLRCTRHNSRYLAELNRSNQESGPVKKA